MPKFDIPVTYTKRALVEIEANTRKEALLLAKELWRKNKEKCEKGADYLEVEFSSDNITDDED